MNKEIKVVDIVAISDFHAEIEAPNEYPIASDFYRLIKKIKGNNPEGTIVLGLGDMFDGPLLSVDLKGIPARKVLEKFGMETTAIGNHEFMFGIDTVMNVTMEDSSFDFICANLFDKGTDKLVYEPYRIFEKAGVKIAVISAAGPAVESAVESKCPEKFYITDGVRELNRYAGEIRAEKKADVVIALVHEGGKVTKGVQTGKLFEFAKGLESIDALYGGHTHSSFVTWMNGIHILNGNSRGRGFIHTRIQVSNDGVPLELASEYVQIGDLEDDANKVELDEEIENIIKKAKSDTNYKYSEVVGYIDRTITSSQLDSPFGESEIGNWVCDVMKAKTGADIALITNRHLGDILKGKVTTGGLYYVTKRGHLFTMNMNLQELKEIMEYAFRDEDIDNDIAKGFGIQVSGIKIKYDMNMPSMNRITYITEEDGTPIDSSRIFSIAVNGRLMNNTNLNTYDFNNPKFELNEQKMHIYEVLADYLRENYGVINIVINKRVENITTGDC